MKNQNKISSNPPISGSLPTDATIEKAAYIYVGIADEEMINEGFETEILERNAFIAGANYVRKLLKGNCINKMTKENLIDKWFGAGETATANEVIKLKVKFGEDIDKLLRSELKDEAKKKDDYITILEEDIQNLKLEIEELKSGAVAG